MKRKGFTLIELLAVIVVLAIIALIAMPTILGVIEKSRRAAYKDSVYGIIDSARLYLASNIGEYDENNEIEFVCNGESCSSKNSSLNFKGNVPKSGSIYVKVNGDILVESLYNGRYYANNDSGEVVITSQDTTMTRRELTELVKTLQNRVNQLENKSSSTDKEINSIKATSTSVNEIYPVGSLFISTSNVNPGTLYPGTEWQVFGEGRTLLGTNSESEKTGGSNSVKLTASQIPTITSTGSTGATTVTSGSTGNGYSWGYGAEWRTTSTNGEHTHNIVANATDFTITNYIGSGLSDVRAGSAGPYGGAHWFTGSYSISSSGNHAHNSLDYYVNSISGVAAHTHQVGIPALTATTTYTNNSQANINIQNTYITVYMWKRVK